MLEEKTKREDYDPAHSKPRALKFEWNKVRKLQTTAAYRTLQCFTGWGFNTLRSIRIDSVDEPSARLCQQFYPLGSFWNIFNLKAINDA